MANPELASEPLSDKVRHSNQGAFLEGLYEAGAKLHDCSAFREEFLKIQPADQRAALAYMVDLNTNRHSQDYSVPEIKGSVITFPGSFSCE